VVGGVAYAMALTSTARRTSYEKMAGRGVIVPLGRKRREARLEHYLGTGTCVRLSGIWDDPRKNRGPGSMRKIPHET